MGSQLKNYSYTLAKIRKKYGNLFLKNYVNLKKKPEKPQNPKESPNIRKKPQKIRYKAQNPILKIHKIPKKFPKSDV